MTVARADVVAAAREQLGTLFHHQGRLKGVALDCVGLVVCIARDLALVAPDFDVKGYARQPDGRSLLAQCDANMERIDIADLAPADVIVLRWEADPQHIAIVADYLHGGLSMIHALGTRDGKGRVVEHRLDDHHLARVIAAYRLPGVA